MMAKAAKTAARKPAKKTSRRSAAKVDPITLSVVRGVLETTQREMTLALEKTARSSVFNLAHDYSTALFNAKPEMILQGQDIPIHLGSLIPAMKSVAKFFEGDIHEGDLILHNDPAFGGSHAIDTCMYKPVFYKGKLVYWTVCKGHLTDIGGPVPAGYNPNAKEIYAECLRIPPVKIWDRGKPRDDVLNMILTNMRARRDQEGDFNALIGACQVGERNLIAMLDNSHSGVYLGLMMFAALPPPYNEGLYRCVSVDFGPKGTICNAQEPAPHMNCTTTPMETLTDAVRLAFEKAMPSKVAASWGHANGLNIAGWDSRTNEEFVTMVLATIISGGGATPQQDGWHAVGPECCFGALTSGDVELLEYSYPIIIHKYSLMTDSGGAGKFRGGSGTAWEVEPLDKEMLCIGFGEGRRIPAMGAAGAKSNDIDSKVGRVMLTRGGKPEVKRTNIMETIKPGETVTNMNPGGGGYGNPYERPIEKVVWDVRNGLVSVNGARVDYGVVITNPQTLDVDMAATKRLRSAA